MAKIQKKLETNSSPSQRLKVFTTYNTNSHYYRLAMITVVDIMDNKEDERLSVIIPEYIVVTSYFAYARIETNHDIHR